MNSKLMRWLLDLEVIPEDTSEPLRLAWEHPWASWVWAMCFLVAGLFAVWSYTKLVGNRKGRGMLAVVRALIILMVLMAISGPVLELPRETIEEDWVLVLVDRSESMRIEDVQSPEGRISRDTQMRNAFDAQQEMFGMLAEQRHLVYMGFHFGAYDLGAREGNNDEQAGYLPVDLGEPDGQRTRLNTALEQALHRAAARPLSGIVLFSDGRTDNPPTRSVIRRLQADSVPVFSIPLGSSEPMGDLAIRRVDAPRRAFVRDKVPVVVEIDRLGTAVDGLRGKIKLVDQLSGEILDEVELDPHENQDRVTLTAEPNLAGETVWEIVIETSQPDLIPANNIKLLHIDLVDRPLRVLMVEGYPRWEYRFVKNLLVREGSIDSSVFLISADRDFAQEGNQPITRLPRSPEEFAEFDVIIIGDVPSMFFSPGQLEMIRDQVAERGTGLLWIAGERWVPSSYAGTVLADLLPMRGSLNIPAIGEPVNMRPTPLAERLGVLRLASGDQIGWPIEIEDSSYGWSQLYYAQKIEPGLLKPTTEVLAETVGLFRGLPLPLVLKMRFGSGQSIYVATDEIWRWRYGRGELYPEQFWVQMIRMLFDIAVLLGDRQRAEYVLGLLAFRGIPDETLNALRGFLHLKEGDIEGARILFETEPQHAEHTYGLVLVSVLEGAHEEAQEFLVAVLQSNDPFLAQAARTIQGAYDEFALFQDGQEEHLHTLLARALAQIGQCPSAQMLLAGVTQEDPDYRDAWIVLGYCQLAMENADRAL
ncbi:MAG: hypothetical protein IH891_03260, partial [Planctomycetes bacterium]|nr:hypothetical protein [Planctomycetota bacterium]